MKNKAYFTANFGYWTFKEYFCLSPLNAFYLNIGIAMAKCIAQD